MNALRWRHAAVTDVGRARAHNEDALLADPESGAFGVADGMGGHAAGEVASALAVGRVREELAGLDGEAATEELEEALRRAIGGANRAIVADARRDPARAGMGTTATVLVLRPRGRWVVGHVGDSRAYLLRDGALRRLTEDHTVVQGLVHAGRVTEEQARVHPKSNVLTRALGVDEEVPVEVYRGEARPGDRFLLATDGLTAMLREPEVLDLLEEEEAAEPAARRLVEAANRAGGADNVTVIVVDVLEAAEG